VSKFDQYLRHTAQELKLSFDRIRATNTDSGVKGKGNETIVAEFIRRLFPRLAVHERIQIIDSEDRISGEMDVVASNEYQPFPAKEANLLLIEGVSFTLQVKAVLNRDEIQRSAKNCTSFKQLLPWHNVGDTAYKSPATLTPPWQAPYVCFAFSSQLQKTTILDELTAVSNVPPETQIDALFVLDRGWSFYNYRQGTPLITESNGLPVVGWGQTDTGDQTLMTLLRFLHEYSPRVVRKGTPLTGYFEKANLPTRGLYKTGQIQPEE